MPDYKRYGIAGATLATILLTGQVMQMTSAQKQASAAEVQAMPLPVEISDIELTAAETEATAAPIVTAALDTDKARPTQPRSAPKAEAICKAEMRAMPIAGALVELDLQAACWPNERVVIHHNGMMFAEATDAEGKLKITAPAMSEAAVFIASFAGGEGAVATTKVDTLKEFDRAVVQMQGGSGVGLHALEFGASYGQSGHISALKPGDLADGATGYGGFLISLGDPKLDNPLVAEVYSYPSAISRSAGDIELNVDIEITEANCGKDLEAQTMQLSQGGEIKVRDLDMTMPDCDAVGDFIMLKKMLNDLKVAFN